MVGRDVSHPRGRILVAENRPDAREILLTAVEELGYDASSVATGTAVAEILATHQQNLALIITELFLPALTAHELVLSLQTAGVAMPVVVIVADDAELEAAAGIGADGILRRPFQVSDVRTCVEAYARSVETSVPNRVLDLGGNGMHPPTSG